MIDTAKEVWDTVEMMIKVKELSPRVSIIPTKDLSFIHIHLAADKPQTDVAIQSKKVLHKRDTDRKKRKHPSSCTNEPDRRTSEYSGRC